MSKKLKILAAVIGSALILTSCGEKTEQNTPIDNTPVDNTPVDNPTEDNPTEDNPSNDNPSNDNPSNDNPSNDNLLNYSEYWYILLGASIAGYIITIIKKQKN